MVGCPLRMRAEVLLSKQWGFGFISFCCCFFLNLFGVFECLFFSDVYLNVGMSFDFVRLAKVGGFVRRRPQQGGP